MMADSSQGIVEDITATMSRAILNVAHRKVGIALVGMWLMSKAPTLEVQKLIFWLCVIALIVQLVQDVVEIIALKRDLPETNGNGRTVDVTEAGAVSVVTKNSSNAVVVSDSKESIG
jgi:hypothetical protein